MKYIIIIILFISLVSCEDAEEMYSWPLYTHMEDLPAYTPCEYTRSLCKPCSNSADCASGDKCISNYVTGERFCGLYCGDDYTCPSGFICAVNFYYRQLSQCVPIDSSKKCIDLLQC
jgi:Cys-rich repeat protein